LGTTQRQEWQRKKNNQGNQPRFLKHILAKSLLALANTFLRFSLCSSIVLEYINVSTNYLSIDGIKNLSKSQNIVFQYQVL